MISRRGFSMIELVVILAILAVFAGTASVRFAASAQRARVEAAARRIVNMIDDARSRAMTGSTVCKVRFIASPPTVTFKSNLSGAAELDTVRLDEAPYRVIMKTAAFGADTDLEFNAYGRPDSGGTVLVADGVFERTIVVDPETGCATIQ